MLGATGVFLELLWRAAVHQAVIEAVARNFVTCRVDPLDQIGILLGYPSEDKEGCMCVMSDEDIQHAEGILLDSPLEGAPGASRNDFLEAAHLEVILNIDRQEPGAHRLSV